MNIAGAFLLWRGAQMREEWIQPYEAMILMEDDEFPESVCMPGNTSCSQSLKIALDFATKEPRPDHKAVLFVFTCQNFYSPKGIRMNNEAYTSYPSEQEYLLQEGSQVYVLSVDRNVIINNTHTSFKDYTGKPVIIIHLFQFSTEF